MRCLVTGSRGFIGKNLVDKLRDSNIIFELEKEYLEHDNWQDTATLDTINPEVIFHVGAITDTLETNINRVMLYNYESTRILSDWARDNNCKFIYSSSAANYGINDKNPSNLYGWSKFCAEHHVTQNNQVSLRYYNCYGPGESHKGNMASVAYQFYKKYRSGEQVKLFPGKPSRDFLYIDDVIEANLHAYQNYDSLSCFYDVGIGVSQTFEDVMEIMNIPYTYHDEQIIPRGYQFYTKSEKSRWMPGWFPKFNLESGLQKYLSYLLS